MDDLISRQAVYEMLDGVEIPGNANWYLYYQQALDRLSKLPSAQPEIIRCKDCRYGVDYYHDGDCYCLNPKWGLMYSGGSWEFFCADAERRTDNLHDD